MNSPRSVRGYLVATTAVGALIAAAGTARANNGCSTYTPTTGQTVTCSSSYAASTSGVQTAINNTGNNSVTVNIDQSAVRSINGSTVGIGSASTVTNAGSLNTQSFFNGYGISFGVNGRSRLGGNTVLITPTGSITTAGTNGDAIHIDSSALTSGANSVTNQGLLTTSGNAAEAIWIDSTRNAVTIVNSGSVLTSGSASNAIDVTNTQSIVSIQNAATGIIRASGNASNAIAMSGATSMTNAGMVCAGSVASGQCVASGNLTANAISLANTTNATRSSISNEATGTIATGRAAAAIASAAGGLDVMNYGVISGGGPDPLAVAFAQGAGKAYNTLSLFGGSSTMGAIAFNLDGTAEALTFSGFVNPEFSNVVTGANVVRAVDGSTITMTAPSYAFAAGSVEVDATSRLNIVGAIIDRGSGPATSLTKSGDGELTLSGVSTYSGATIITAGTLMLLGSINSNTTVSSAGTLRGTGMITGDLENAGRLAPGTASQIGTLTIEGSYVGVGGTLATRVGGTPAAPVADVLRISGAGNTASGSTGIQVDDLGGLGALTTGNGILVVDAANGAATTANAFTLADRVAAGAYEYNLVRGATSSAQQNWYLSTYAEPLPIDPGPGPGPGPDPIPEPEKPTYRVETSNYPALPAIQRLYTYALVDTLAQRRGPIAASAAAKPDGSAGWGRAGGNFGSASASGADGLDMDYSSGFLQAGLDAVVASDGHGGRINSGVFLALGTAGSDTATQANGATGTVSFGAWSGGVYGTWISASGFYGDVLAQATRFTGADADSTGNQSISTNGWSESLSLETGYRVDLSSRASLTPQGQIIFENFSLDGTSDDFGDVDFGNGYAARGRLGLELGSSVDGAGHRTDMTLRGNVWHVFADNPQTTFTTFDGEYPVSFDADIGTTWLEVDAGLSAAVDGNLSIFGNASFQYGLDGGQQAGTGRVGFTYAW